MQHESVNSQGSIIVPDLNTGIVLYWQQFRAMFLKRVLHTWRNMILIIVQLFIPIICTLFAILATKFLPSPGNSYPITLNMETYGKDTIAPFTSYDPSSSVIDQLTRQYADQFVNTGTTAVNVSTNASYDMLDYLIDRREETLSEFFRVNLISSTFDDVVLPNNATRVAGVALFQETPYHAPPIALNALDNALLSYYLNDSYQITTINHPLPRTIEEQASDQLNLGVQTGFAISFNMLFGMSFLASSFVVFLIKVRIGIKKRNPLDENMQSNKILHHLQLWPVLLYNIQK